MNNILNITGEKFKILSQQRYSILKEPDCIIDIVIKNTDNLCFIKNKVESEESLRTITNVDYAVNVNVLNQEHIDRYSLNAEDYITAYCHKREEQRTFRFDRINELEILNV